MRWAKRIGIGLLAATTVLGLLLLAAGSGPGTRWIVRRVIAGANERLDGSITVGTVHGSLFRRIQLGDVTVRDPRGTVVAEAENLEVGYSLLGLIRGRFVLGPLVVDKPIIRMVQLQTSESFTITELFPDEPTVEREPPRRPLVIIESATIDSGTIIVLLPSDDSLPTNTNGDGDSTGVGTSGSYTVHVTGINMSLPFARLSSPDPAEPLRIEVASLQASIADPPLRIWRGRGEAELDADTIRLATVDVATDRSELHVAGWVVRDTIATATSFDVAVVIRQLVTDDFTWISPEIPPGWIAEGSLTARSVDTSSVRVQISQLDVTAESDSSHVHITGSFVAERLRRLRIEDPVMLRVDRFDTEHLRALLQEAFVPGRLEGTLVARGTEDALDIDLDVALRDAAHREQAGVRLRGDLAFSADDVLRFGNVTIQRAFADLLVVRNAGFAVPLDGRIDLRGNLSGRLYSPQFRGSVVHYGGARDPTRVRGLLGVEYDVHPMVVLADIVADSLQLDAFTSGVEGVDLTGTVGGELRVRGPLDSLPFHVRLAGAIGQLAMDGQLRRWSDSLSLDSVRLVVGDVDASRLIHRAFSTNLNGEVRADRLTFSSDAYAGALSLTLGPSSVHDIAIDSGRAHLALADNRLRVDTIEMRGPGLELAGLGEMRLDSIADDRLTARMVIDSIAILYPLLGEPSGDDAPGDALAGAFELDLDASRSPSDLTLDATLTAPHFAWNTFDAVGVLGTARWSQENRALAVQLDMDSLQAGGAIASNLRTRAEGSNDRWHWDFATSIAEAGTWAGSGRVQSDSAGYVTSIDSLIIDLWESRWFADSGATLVFGDRRGEISGLVLRRRTNNGQLAVNGVLPSADSGHVELVLERLPIGDVLRMAGQIDSLPMRGELGATLTVAGPAAAAHYQLAASMTNATADSLPLPDLHTRLAYQDREVRGTWTIAHQGRDLALGEVSFPLEITFPATVRSDSGPVMLTAMLDSVPGSLIDPFVPAIRDVGGSLAGRVEIGGTLTEPDVRGSMNVIGASMTLPALGTRYDRIDGSLRFAADTVYIDSLTLGVQRGGSVQATGYAHLDDLRNPRLAVDVVGSDFLAINTEEYSGVRVSGRVRLTGPVSSATLTGDATVNAALLEVNDILEKHIIDLEDSLFAAFVDTLVLREEHLGNPFAQRFMDSLRIDRLRLQIGSDVWVRSTEAYVQLGGSMVVNKVGDRYPIVGILRAIRGTYRLVLGPGVTREFTVTGGEISYFGTDSLEAFLDVNARHTVRTVRGEQLVVFVHIGGTMSSPVVTLSSDRVPAIPETEIISYLMFGAPSVQVFAGTRGREQRSVFQQGATQFTRLLAGRLEQSLSGLVDYLAITPGDPSDGFSETEILVGKQLDLFGRPSFVTFSPRLCPRQPLSGWRNLGLSLETWLTQHWLLDASLDPRHGCDTSASPSSTTYQLGVDLLWVLR